MKKRTRKHIRSDELRSEYDLGFLKGGVQGKYAARFKSGTNLVLLSPDIEKHFPDKNSVTPRSDP
jgi:hypothetical protein